MDYNRNILIPLIMACLLSTAALKAQPKAISSLWSFSGIGIGYEHNLKDNSFIQFSIKTHLVRPFEDLSWTPDATLDFSWNMIFRQFRTSHGSDIFLFAGPGGMIGWTDDLKTPYGAVFGVKGRLGAECHFTRQVSIAMSIAPVIGMHLSVNREGDYNMRTYRNGLIYDLLPELGIKYRFGR